MHALLGVLLPTTLVHSQLYQKRLTRPTCVNNREHSTILFSHARCGAMFLELRSVGAWPNSNTWYRPFLRAGTWVGCFFLKGDALVLLRMGMLLRDLHYDHLDKLEGHHTASLQRHGCCATCQIITETAPSVHGAVLVVQSLRSHSQVSCHLYLGATPSVQAIVHQMGTFLIHLSS